MRKRKFLFLSAEPQAPMDPERREALRRWLARLEPVARWAVRLDPAYSGGGRQRAMRAVEVALLTGRPLSWWQVHAREEGVIVPWYIRLTLPRPVLHRRIEARVKRMLARGLVDEVRGVLADGVAPQAPGLDAVGYREVVRHLAGELDDAALGPAIVGATRRYAKRQETWFRHQLGAGAVTLDATAPPAELAKTIVELWSQRES